MISEFVISYISWDLIENCTKSVQLSIFTETGSYFRLIDSCITQLKAQGPSRTCNESKEEGT